MKQGTKNALQAGAAAASIALFATTYFAVRGEPDAASTPAAGVPVTRPTEPELAPLLERLTAPRRAVDTRTRAS